MATAFVPSLWHLILAVLRLPRMNSTFKAAISGFHTIQACAAMLVLVAAMSPGSEALTYVARVAAYISWPRADVDIGPAAWYTAFFAAVNAAAIMGAGLVWLHFRGSSLARYAPAFRHGVSGHAQHTSLVAGGT